MFYKAKKIKMLTLYDYEYCRPITPKGDIVVIYLVVYILNKKIEDAIHLHIDLPIDIDRNMFTEEFCEKFFQKLPDTFDVYYGSDNRCKIKDINMIIELIKTV